MSLSSAVAHWITASLRILRVILLLVIVSAIVTTLVSAYNITPDSIAWNWLELLIVPAVIALAGLWFNRQQRERELQIAAQRTRAEALEAYLDNMSEPLHETEAPLHSAKPGDSLTIVERARTLSVLPRLDGNQKRTVLVFLYETGLLNAREGPVISLNHADLTNYQGTTLS
jgi:type VI protein secretion system component VasK